jgi:hypothetical protein
MVCAWSAFQKFVLYQGTTLQAAEILVEPVSEALFCISARLQSCRKEPEKQRALQAAEKLIRNGTKCQGTTLVVP